MKIYVNVKAIGKKKPVFQRIPYTLKKETDCLRSVITQIVNIEVDRYNSKDMDPELQNTPPKNQKPELLPWLSSEEIEDKKESGKIAFGRRYSQKDQAIEKAVDNAIQSFEDGLFRVFINEEEITDLDSNINLKPDDELTFIRLTFLSGTLW